MSGCVDANQILPGIWLGSVSSVKHFQSLLDAGVTHVLTVMTHEDIVERGLDLPDSINWTIISVRDEEEEHLYDHFEAAINMIETVLKSGGRILVHCVGGISRSPTVIIAYVMWKLGLRLTAAIEYVRARRSYIDPNWTFYGDLVKFEEDLYKQMEMGDVPNKTR